MHPYDDSNVIIGQGTIGLEFMEDIKDLDLLVIPIGGGGLISGISIVAKALNPNIKIYGVQTEKFPSMYNVLHKKHLEILGDTLADGIAVKRPGKITSEIVKDHVDDILLINEFGDLKPVNSLYFHGVGVIFNFFYFSAQIRKIIKLYAEATKPSNV